MKVTVLALLLTTSIIAQQPSKPDTAKPPTPPPTLSEADRWHLQALAAQRQVAQDQLNGVQGEIGAFIQDVEKRYPGYTLNPQGQLVPLPKTADPKPEPKK